MDFPEKGNIATVITAIVAPVTFLILHRLSKIIAERKRKAELAGWVSNALSKRNAKNHSCLTSQKTSSGIIEDDGIGNILHSAAETRRMILSGELDAATNLMKLAIRCRRYGRNNIHDTGINAITEEFYDEGYEVAKGLVSNSDASVKERVFPPLYGVPISVKDCISMNGALQTGGLACRTSESHRSTEDSPLVQILRSAGAIPIVRGNVGQLMMLPESHNNVWGTTRNPWDLSRVPGGSSGGEAALVSMKCVPLAIGSDVAGSIRIPAAYCGIVGFKPTSTRLSNRGSMRPRKDNKHGTGIAIPAVPGPIARTVEDCALFMKSVCVPKYYEMDSNLPPFPFNSKAYEDKKSLKIGYFVTDGWFEPCAAAKRGLTETIKALEKAGHECVPFEVPTSGWDTYALLVSINAGDGNMRAYVEALEGEDMIEGFRTLFIAANLPNYLRPLLRKVIDKRRANLIGCSLSGGITVYDYLQKNAELLEMREKWGQSFIEAGVDAIIHPALPTPALPHGIAGDFTAAFSYTFLANMLLWPAGVLPVTTVKEDEQHYKMEDVPFDQRDSFAKLANKVMVGSAGLPVSISIMTPLFQDEKCLRVMKEVESLVKFDKEPVAYKEVTY